ncbi:MAG: ThuA domain-containing protein [Novosphingobium sp.]
MPRKLVLLAAALLASTPALAAPTDCPLRDAPFSVDSPLVDVLLSPAASAVLDRFQSGMTTRLPPEKRSTKAPTFLAILSPRVGLSLSGVRDPARVAEIDAALRALPVTPADRIARCERYDNERPRLTIPKGKLKLLLFEKMTGFRDGPSVEAAKAMFQDLARRNGWALVITDKAGVMNPAQLARFDAVIWNNVSGDVLTLSQRRAFEQYIAGGGGYVGVHGAAGDFIYFWDWYADTLIGARFADHTGKPHFQDARVAIEANPAGIGASLAPGWTMQDEWYSFRASPRLTGATVVATLDETSYNPVGNGGQSIAMGDHPIAWTRCLGDGRSFYSAIGHLPESYSDPRHLRLLEDAIRWAAGKGTTRCRAGRQVAPR